MRLGLCLRGRPSLTGRLGFLRSVALTAVAADILEKERKKKILKSNVDNCSLQRFRWQ